MYIFGNTLLIFRKLEKLTQIYFWISLFMRKENFDF